MINPWLSLPTSSPHVLSEDRLVIDNFNVALPVASPFRIATDGVIPEPFVGAVTTAPVVVLQLNPGHDDTNVASHADPEFRAALFGNLCHAEVDWPFYFFDPRFRDSHPGGRWWIKKTKELAKAIPLATLAQRLAVVEWFPYKSTKYKRGCRVNSQAYGFALVEAAITRGALIVVSRSIDLWEESVPALRTHPRKLTLSSRQNVSLTPNNLKMDGQKTQAAWDLLIEALR